MEELTVKCINDLRVDNLFYIKGHEYQADNYPLFVCVYNNGGWRDYIYVTHEEFEKYFEFI
jgi:hypothetical protein